jgi:hypothetical protein
VENLDLRHQLGVLRRSVKRPKLTSADRLLWIWLSEVWSDWRSCLTIVKPETVIACASSMFSFSSVFTIPTGPAKAGVFAWETKQLEKPSSPRRDD